MNFKNRLKLLRKAKNSTQKEMGKVAGVSERTYRRYESGEIEPPVSNILLLADYFDVSLDYIMGRSNNPNRY